MQKRRLHKGTAYDRIHKVKQETVITLLGNGCPIQAMVMAMGLDERTVRSLQNKVGNHCEKIHKTR